MSIIVTTTIIPSFRVYRENYRDSKPFLKRRLGPTLKVGIIVVVVIIDIGGVLVLVLVLLVVVLVVLGVVLVVIGVVASHYCYYY